MPAASGPIAFHIPPLPTLHPNRPVARRALEHVGLPAHFTTPVMPAHLREGGRHDRATASSPESCAGRRSAEPSRVHSVRGGSAGKRNRGIFGQVPALLGL